MQLDSSDSLDPSIRSLIALLRRSPNWNVELDLELLRKFWPALVGAPLARIAPVAALRDGTLVVSVPDKVWRKELAGMKGVLLGRINASIAGLGVRNIAFIHENH
jgi:predicted nucleic acid-binding Zn ribbon protein